MNWECVEDKVYPGEWRVEGIDDDGDIYVTVFSGPRARERAEDYHMGLIQ
jgi:hypothetical protein